MRREEALPEESFLHTGFSKSVSRVQTCKPRVFALSLANKAWFNPCAACSQTFLGTLSAFAVAQFQEVLRPCSAISPE